MTETTWQPGDPLFEPDLSAEVQPMIRLKDDSIDFCSPTLNAASWPKPSKGWDLDASEKEEIEEAAFYESH